MNSRLTHLSFLIFTTALLFPFAYAEDNQSPKLTKEQQLKIQYAEEQMESLKTAAKDDYAKILADLSASDKVVSETVYKFVLNSDKATLRIDLLGVLRKIDAEKAKQLEQQLLENGKKTIKPDTDIHVVGELLWEMRALGPASEPYFWELFDNPNLKEAKPMILQKILELNLPATREKILRLLETGQLEPVSLIASAAKFPDTDGRAKKAILPLLKHPKYVVRLSAFEALSKLKAPELYKESVERIADPDVLVRQGAVEYLAGYIKVSPENAAAAAEDIIKKIPEQHASMDEIVFKSCLKLLALSRSSAALEFLRNRLLLEDKQKYIELFLTTLTDMGTAEAYEFLIEQYNQMRERGKELIEPAKAASLSLQLFIIKNLRHPADLKAARNDMVITRLIAILRSPDVPDSHRLEACITLQVLTGNMTGLNPDLWEDWWRQEKSKIRLEE